MIPRVRASDRSLSFLCLGVRASNAAVSSSGLSVILCSAPVLRRLAQEYVARHGILEAFPGNSLPCQQWTQGTRSSGATVPRQSSTHAGTRARLRP